MAEYLILYLNNKGKLTNHERYEISEHDGVISNIDIDEDDKLDTLLTEIKNKNVLSTKETGSDFVGHIVIENGNRPVRGVNIEEYKIRASTDEEFDIPYNIYKPENYSLLKKLRKLLGKPDPPPLVNMLKQDRILTGWKKKIFKSYKPSYKQFITSKCTIHTTGYLYNIGDLDLFTRDILRVVVDDDIFNHWLLTEGIIDKMDFVCHYLKCVLEEGGFMCDHCGDKFIIIKNQKSKELFDKITAKMNHVNYVRKLSTDLPLTKYNISKSLTITKCPYSCSYLFNNGVELSQKLKTMIMDMINLQTPDSLLERLGEVLTVSGTDGRERNEILSAIWKGLYEGEPFLPCMIGMKDYQDISIKDMRIPVFLKPSPYSTRVVVEPKVCFLPWQIVFQMMFSQDVLEYSSMLYFADS